MEEHFDYIILGTGITECVLSWALSTKGHKVLQIDRNESYGSDMRTYRYTELEAKYANCSMIDELVGLDREFCIDLLPKLLLADGGVKKFLETSGVFDIVEFVKISESYIFKNKRKHNIPCSEGAALKSGIVGIMQKPKVVSFFWDVRNFCNMSEEERMNSYANVTMEQHFNSFRLNKDAKEFIGHAIALNLDDSYLNDPAIVTLRNIELYLTSLLSYGDQLKSPYIYPMYGSSEISQAFSRKAAICGATFRLNCPVLAIAPVNGGFEVSIEDKIEKKTAKLRCKKLLGDPSYFPSMVSKTGSVIQSTCIIKGDVKLHNTKAATQVIFLASELGRVNDVFLLILSDMENACPKGYKIAMISTVAETSNPEDEISRIISMLGDVQKIFVEKRCLYEPSSSQDNIYISRSVDQSTHFESIYLDVLRLAKELKIEGVFEN